MPFFDVTQETHKALLPAEYRAIAELNRLASEAEADILNQYTTRFDPRPYTKGAGDSDRGYELRENVYVQLDGYDPDPEQADPGLAEALRRETAALIVWRHQRERMNLMLQSETKGDKSTTVARAAYDPFPPSSGRWLRPYDLRNRTGLWSI